MVQKAVHRVQPAEQVFALMAAARQRGFESINVDLIYGLPGQTPESFDRTLSQIIELRPDRIALYAYAHLPERFKPQRRISTVDIPTAAAKVSMLARSMAAFMSAQYVYIGMDCLAAQRLTRRCQAARSIASQLSGLQHTTGLRHDWIGCVIDWTG